MCIRDRSRVVNPEGIFLSTDIDMDEAGIWIVSNPDVVVGAAQVVTCLLYTSDAADERSSVDLGGRRIIKNKKKQKKQKKEKKTAIWTLKRRDKQSVLWAQTDEWTQLQKERANGR